MPSQDSQISEASLSTQSPSTDRSKHSPRSDQPFEVSPSQDDTLTSHVNSTSQTSIHNTSVPLSHLSYTTEFHDDSSMGQTSRETPQSTYSYLSDFEGGASDTHSEEDQIVSDSVLIAAISSRTDSSLLHSQERRYSDDFAQDSTSHRSQSAVRGSVSDDYDSYTDDFSNDRSDSASLEFHVSRESTGKSSLIYKQSFVTSSTTPLSCHSSSTISGSQYTKPLTESLTAHSATADSSVDLTHLQYAKKMMEVLQNPVTVKVPRDTDWKFERISMLTGLSPAVTDYTAYVKSTCKANRQLDTAVRPPDRSIRKIDTPDAELLEDHYINRRATVLRAENVTHTLKLKSEQLDREIAEHLQSTREYRSQESSRQFSLHNRIALNRDVFQRKYDSHVNKMSTVSMIGEIASELPYPTTASSEIWHRLLHNRNQLLADRLSRQNLSESD